MKPTKAVCPGVLGLAVCAAVVGCYGGLSGGDVQADGGGSDDSAGDSGGVDDGGEEPACADGVAAGLAPMRRLTKRQYENTIADLFGGAVAPSDQFPVSVIHEGYTNNPAANIVSLSSAEDILLAAEDVAAQVVDDVGAVVACDPADGDACAESFIADFGYRAFRRPLLPEEHQQLVTVYADAAAVDGFADGIGTVVSVVLQSPQFLYLVEVGAEDVEPGVVALGDFEIASRLSYLVWDTMPDDALFAAAEAGELQQPQQIAAQVERMLADAGRAGPALDRFFREWMHFDGVPPFDKDAAAFPEYDDALAASMDEELSRFIASVLFSDEPTMARLLTSPQTEVDAAMASFYGIAPPADGQWTPVVLPETRRPGLLSRPALLAEHSTKTSSAPIFRGRLVRTQLLCGVIPPPPPDAMQNAPEYPPDATERERTQILIEHMNCGGCHALMNPIGLGFEHYDPIGRWRDLDVDGSPVDARGEIIGGDPDAVGAFDGVTELGARLADSPGVAACLSREMYKHALGLQAEQALACASEPIEHAFVESGGDLRRLVVQLATSDAFRMRILEQ